ncbi:MAG: cytosine permease [Clostridiales bacterium]|jgi:cytosine permease|nr:cytosine permease [Clostridiales bacterium]
MQDNTQPGFQIEESKRQSWVSLAAVWIGTMVCVPCLMVGGLLSSGFPLGTMFILIVLGYAIICAFMCFMGMQGCDTGLPTVSLAESALGKTGARFLISLILAIACVGWFGIQSAVCGSSFSFMIADMTGLVIPAPVSTLIWGAIMFLTAVFGYNAVKYLNYIAVPALIIVLVWALFAALFQNDGIARLGAHIPPAPMSIISGINLVVATFAVGGVISADFSRYARNRRDVIKSSVIGVLPSGLVVLFLGAICSVVAGQYDISLVFSALGLPAIGLIGLILATWTTNVTNAYSGGIAVSNIFGLGEDKRKIATAIAGALGTILGAVGIMDRFTSFLNVITSFVPPVAGVIIASYWIIGKGKRENFVAANGFNVAGLAAFALGAAVAYITSSVLPFFIAPINGIVVSMAAYIALIRIFPADVRKVVSG